MNKILITGFTGFVGQNLESYLKEDYSLLGVSRNNEADVISYEKLDIELLNTSRAFIHLAGKAHDLNNVSKPQEYFEVNTELTKKLFNLFLESDCEKFIYISSVKAVADKLDNVLTENQEPMPLTPYGQSKLAAEQYLLSCKIPEEKKVYILRPCMIHGPNNKGNLNLLYKFISKGIPYPLGKYDNERSFVSIENLCFIIKKILEVDFKTGIYNIADDKPISTRDLVKLIGEEIEKPVRIINFPKWMINGLATLGDITRLPFNTHRVDKLTENYIVSNRKIKQELKIDLPVSTIEGLRKTINSF